MYTLLRNRLIHRLLRNRLIHRLLRNRLLQYRLLAGHNQGWGLG